MTSADTVGQRFAEVCSAQPDSVALQIDDRRWSYRELADELSARIAELDRTEPDVARPVAVVVDGSATTVAAMLAVLMSPRPLIPIDAASPVSRTAGIVAEVGALLHPDSAVTDQAVPDHTEAGDRTATTRRPSPRRAPLDGCAILAFTSGSTGTPKAVRQGHDLWLHQARDLSGQLGITSGTVVAQALPPGFGGGLDIIVTSLLNGAQLVLADPRLDGTTELVATLSACAPESLQLTPALLRALMATPGCAAALASVQVVATCGEAIDAADVARLRSLAPSATFVNRSGSSETGNLAFNAFPPHRPLPTGLVPAGKVASGKHIRVLGDDGSTVPPGTTGIIEVTSPYLAQGYLVGGEIIDFPVIETVDGSGARRHLVGDAGHLLGDQLHLTGRVDDTVKIRGYRVDVGEVAAAARALPDVGDAAVVVREIAGRPALVAYLSPPPGARPPAIAAVRQGLSKALPSWMVPAHTVLLAELPRTERGKIDRMALPDPAVRAGHAPPATTTERLLAPIWSDLLAVADIGRDDDFVALGGDSLTVLTLLDRVDDAFGVRLPVSVPVVASTLRGLAREIDSASPTTAATEVIMLPGSPSTHDTGSVTTVFAFAGAGESALAFAPLARRLPGVRMIGLHAHGLESRGLPDWTIRRAARRCVGHIRAAAPHGPYRFVGHSLGGVIAMEAANILVADGERVEHIVCLDTIVTGPLQRRTALELDSTVDAPDEGDRDCRDGEGRDRDTADRQGLPDTPDTPTGTAVWRTRLALMTAGWWPRPTEEQWSLFHELGRRSALLHRLRPWHGPVTVVLAEDNPDPIHWWDALAPEHVGLHRVTGDHNGILRAPHVDRVAGIVADSVTGARV
ncbi:AMP-binding protein [Gordonia sp. NPDC003950]